MTSMRIDAGASAKLWANRMRKLIDAIEEDGGQVRAHRDLPLIAVFKDGEGFTTGQDEVEDE